MIYSFNRTLNPIQSFSFFKVKPTTPLKLPWRNQLRKLQRQSELTDIILLIVVTSMQWYFTVLSLSLLCTCILCIFYDENIFVISKKVNRFVLKKKNGKGVRNIGDRLQQPFTVELSPLLQTCLSHLAVGA